MFAVIFAVNPKPEQWEAYLGYAKLLRPELEQIDGFIDNERFSSLRREGWLLSLSIWRGEKGVVCWRTPPPPPPHPNNIPTSIITPSSLPPPEHSPPNPTP